MSENMSAAVCAFFLTVSALSTAVSDELGRPTNVRVTSYNMNLVLKWDPPEGAPGGVVYTTEYKSPVTASRVGCVNISRLECDFTHLNVSITVYGTYTGRVRAQLGPHSSTWVESNQIVLDKDTIIGPPKVSLFSSGASIDVAIENPVFAVSTLMNAYDDITYDVTYWKDGQEGQVKSIASLQQNRVVLPDLDFWTKYCVQVRIKTQLNQNPSEPSTPVCESTTNREEVPWVAAVVTFIVMAAAVVLVVVAVVYRKKISHLFCPKDVLPQHFKEYLLAPPSSSLHLAMRNSHPPEEKYHQVSIVTEEGLPLEEAATSCSVQPDVTAAER